MAINPNIALQIRPVETPTFADSYGRALGIQQRRQAVNLQQQQIEENALGLQKQQRIEEDDARVMDAFRRGKHPDEVLDLAVRNGIHSDTLGALRKQLTAEKKALLDADEAKLKVGALEADNNLGMLSSMAALPPDQLAANWGTFKSEWDRRNPKNPLAATPLDRKALEAAGVIFQSQSLWNKQEAERRAAKAAEDAAKKAAHEQRQFADQEAITAADAKKAAHEQRQFADQEAKTAADARKAGADAGTAKLVADYVANSKDYLTPDQTRQMKAQAATDANSKRGNAIAAESLVLRQKQFNATIGSGLDANGRPLSPEDLKVMALQDPTAQAIANYQIKPPLAVTRGGKESPIWRKILAINPNYKETLFTSRNKVQQDFSPSGASGKAITAADTALSHLDSISQAGKALDSGDVQLLNRIANYVGAQTGSSAPTVYDSIVETVAPEISKAVIGSIGGVEDRRKMAANFDRKLAPVQREGAVGANVGLLSARVQKQAHAFEQEMETPLNLEKRLSPTSVAVMKKYGSGSPTTAPAAAKPAVGGYKINGMYGGKTYLGGDPKDAGSWR